MMKLLLILGFVACAAAYVPGVHDQVCRMCSCESGYSNGVPVGPKITSFDGATLGIMTADKTLMAKSDDPNDDCGISISCVTADEYYADDNDGPIWLDWCGFSFWVHKNPTKLFRNWVLGQSLIDILERGQGFSGSVCRQLNANNSWRWLFPFVNEDTTTWHADITQPFCDPVYTLSVDLDCGCITIDGGNCCPWAVKWCPDVRDTCIDIYAKGPNHPYVGRMEGMCQNMNGDPTDDDQMCDGGGSGTVPEIELSCQTQDHDGQGYEGGTKLRAVC